SEGSDDEDISDLKKITALLAKAFNQKNYYAKPTNNNLRTSSASSLTNKKPKYVKSVEKKEDKKVDEKRRDTSKVKCYNCKKEEHFAKNTRKQRIKLGWSPVVILIRKSMQIWSLWLKWKRFFQIQTKVLHPLTKPLLRNFHDAIESASENFIENHIDSQKDYDKSEVDHSESKERGI
nr:hypothetical protein [Tanacetum cinerariifolium]